MKKDKAYIVSPTFEKIHADLSKVIFVMGPIGSGTTTGCIFHAFLRAMQQPPDSDGIRRWRHGIIRATTPALKRSIIPSCKDWFGDDMEIKMTTPITGKIIVKLDDGTTLHFEIWFMGVEDDNAVELLRSVELSSAHINEASEITQYIYQLVKSRTKRYPDKTVKNPFTICDYNAISTDHWLYKLTEEEKPKGVSFYKQPPAAFRYESKDGKVTYEINPNAENLDNLAPGYYEDMLESSPDDFIRVNIMNEYGEVRKGKPVYSHYNDFEHSFDDEENEDTVPFKPHHDTKIIIGMDAGLTPAAVFTQQQYDGTVYVFEEIVTTDCSVQEFVEEKLKPLIYTKYKKYAKNMMLVVDPALTKREQYSGNSILKMLKEDLKLPIKPAVSNDPKVRIDSVTNFLRIKGKFKLSSRCKTLRKGFISEYKYAKANLIENVPKEPKPEKNIYSHVHDALQYAILTYDHGNRNALKLQNLNQIKRKFPTRAYTVPSQIGGY